MVGDLVTTEAPPLAGLAARRRLLARLRSAGTLAYKLATTDHKVIGIMYLVASAVRGMTAVDASSCGRLAQVPDGVHSSASPSPHESLRNMVLAVLSAPGGALLLAGCTR
jgi:hypothetical protein